MKKIIITIIMMFLCVGSVLAEFNLPINWIYNQVNHSSIDSNSNGIVDYAENIMGGLGSGNITGSIGPYLFNTGPNIDFNEVYLNATIDDKISGIGGGSGNWTNDRPYYINNTVLSSILSVYINTTRIDSDIIDALNGATNANGSNVFVTESSLDTAIYSSELILETYVDNIVASQNNVSLTTINGLISANGNWSDDKSDYYISSSVDTIISNQNNVSVGTIIGLVSANGNWSNDKSDYSLTGTDPNYLDLAQTNWLNDTDGYIYWAGGNTITFNQSKLETIYINVSSVDSVVGTVSGELSYIQEYDGISLNVTEAIGSPGLDFRLNFTDVTEFNQMILRYRTTDREKHTTTLYLWDYTTSTWESYGTAGAVTEFTYFTFPVFDYADHIQNETVQMRIYSPSNGNTNHVHQFDWVTLTAGFATPAGVEIDPYWNSDRPNYINTTIISYYINTTIISDYVNANGNWSDDKSDYYTASNVNTIISNQNNVSVGTIIGLVGANGNWSDEKSSYTTTGNDANYVAVTGDIMTGELNMSSNNVTSVDCIVGKTGGKVCFV